ncbi:50S ribosomal protein L29 [Pseudanabaena sp. FACHB-2040]|uniref:50S ribosomal protein L29 n=1 Tax=Pseudanabaena sp. FACHB-2040 TaxID=2692859 RepID=UPI0016881921|nr:50S ribosomal protein L29 [Pseudanabaena sp. FACHB-2040]MBD2258108.1 50S ribosomal protein L29 [Pseudanabaena sp. FACHB-2040]
MALPKIADARKLNDEELLDEIVATKRRLFQLRFQKATRQLDKQFHQFKHERHRLAQLMTVQRERQLAAVAEEAQAPAAVAE